MDQTNFNGWRYKNLLDCGCEVCLDNGFYLEPAEQIETYPKGTPLSLRKFTPPRKVACPKCNA